MPAATIERADVIAFRFRRHQLDRAPDSADPLDVDLLDYGVQDTGTEGSRWALTVRGARPAADDDLLMAWTLRGAPHVYRRRDARAIMVATAPFSEADAASRVFDASKPLRNNGIAVLDALVRVAKEMRDIARRPISKGDMSTELSRRLDPPYLRFCRVCDATHTYEQPFRLSALQAGLELEPGTSPPVLHRIKGVTPTFFARPGTEAKAAFDVIRSYLRFFGPAPVKAIATYLDSPVAEVNAHLPADAVEVGVSDAPGKVKRFALEEDLDGLIGAAKQAEHGVVRLVGSHDPYLQLRDRDLLVADTAQQKDLWRILGRPGAIVLDGEVAGTWRPRASGGSLSLQIDPWIPLRGPVRKALQAEAERLAAYRGVKLAKVTEAA